VSNPALNPEKLKILIHDADAERCHHLAGLLRAEGCSVVETATSAAALASLEQDPPALALVSVMSNDAEAISLCGVISKGLGWNRPPVLMMLDRDDAHLCGLGRHAGVSDLIMLPCPDEWFVSRVQHHLDAAQDTLESRRTSVAHAHAEQLARIGSWELDTQTNLMHWSDETFRVLGHEPGDTPTTHAVFWQAVHPDDRDMVQYEAGQSLGRLHSYTIEHRIVRPDGSIRYVQQHGELMVGDGRHGRWLAGSIQDVTRQRLDQERIRYLANYDSLTGLANRRFFGEQLESVIEEAKYEGRTAALLYMDLNKFKRLNDTLGHSAGDKLLRHVANLLRANTRGDDLVARPGRKNASANVSRLGGDEFMVLLSDITGADDAGDVAERILEQLPKPVEIEGHQVSVLGSIGIAIFPTDGLDGDALIRQADTAMYAAKEGGRNSFKYFSPSMNKAAERRLVVDSRLRSALEEGLLEVYYQPKIDLVDGTVCGMEALARWTDAELGSVSPVEFIRLAEESGQIYELGKQVLETACDDTQKLLEDHGLRLKVSVNVSGVQFSKPGFRNVVSDALRDSGLDPALLELEITESLMLEDNAELDVMMSDLKAMGLSISLDDFGTGYASISYLTQFPLDTLKLDRSILREITSDPAAAQVASALVVLAHSLGLDVVAEGVDLEEQRTLLTEWGCDMLQGFLASPALPLDEFLQFAQVWGRELEKPES
jgi:diguanylate cyclase (GGDEF)-like protein/PAS domain S-box-containing protein